MLTSYLHGDMPYFRTVLRKRRVAMRRRRLPSIWNHPAPIRILTGRRRAAQQRLAVSVPDAATNRYEQWITVPNEMILSSWACACAESSAGPKFVKAIPARSTPGPSENTWLSARRFRS